MDSSSTLSEPVHSWHTPNKSMFRDREADIQTLNIHGIETFSIHHFQIYSPFQKKQEKEERITYVILDSLFRFSLAQGQNGREKLGIIIFVL